jgi:hypothetical protein
MGGSFGADFLSGSLGSYLGSSGHSKNMSEMIGNTARDAVVGGTISVVGGGILCLFAKGMSPFRPSEKYSLLYFGTYAP